MTVASPCVRNCCLDQHEICLGCFRTLREITQWTYLSETEKQCVIDATQKRRQAHDDKFGKLPRKI